MSLEEIKKEIRGKRTDGPVSRFINRRVSNLITLTIVKYGIPLTPNHVSVISFILGLLAALLYSKEHLILGAILVEVSSIVDGVDGELARVKKMVSPRGGFFDTMLDRAVDILVYLGLFWPFLSKTPQELQIASLATVLAVSGDLFVTYFHSVTELKFGSHPALIGVIPPLASRDVRLFVLFIGTLAGYVVPTLIAVAIISYMYVIVKAIEVMISS